MQVDAAPYLRWLTSLGWVGLAVTLLLGAGIWQWEAELKAPYSRLSGYAYEANIPIGNFPHCSSMSGKLALLD